MNSFLKKLFYIFPPLIWMGIIYYFSSRQKISVSADSTLNFIFFKTLHVIEYAVLYFLLFRAYKNLFSLRKFTWWSLTAYVTTVLYAATDETHQLLVPGREGRLRDVIIDASGALISWIIIAKLLPVLPKKLKQLAVFWGIL
jgi:VanZ family protein